MKHAYRISRKDSSAAPDKTATCSEDDFLEKLWDHANECGNRIAGGTATKAVITIERIVVED